jgi:hypothetical protein
LNNECETVKLFSNESMEKHGQKYSFIYIGLISTSCRKTFN